MTLDLKPVLDLEPVESKLDLQPLESELSDIPFTDAVPAPTPQIDADTEARAIEQLGQRAALAGLENDPAGAAIGNEYATRQADFLQKFPKHPYSLKRAQAAAEQAAMDATRITPRTRLDAALESPTRFIDRMGFNALPMVGALAGARLLTVKGLQALPATASAGEKLARAATVAAPIGGMVAGGGLAGLAQEKAMSAAETPEETQARHEEQARLGQTTEGKLADLATMALVARPSISGMERALAGDVAAMQNIGVGVGLGGGLATANAALEGRLPTSRELAGGMTEGALFSTPTRLGARLMGLGPDAPPKVTAEQARQDVQQNVLNVEGVLPENRMPIVSANKSITEAGLDRPLSSEEAFIVATQGLDAVRQRPAESGTLEAGYREAGGVTTPKLSLEEIRQQGTTPPDPNRQLGPGAANIEEFGPQRTIGAYNAAVDAQRAERGLQPLMSEARKENQVVWDAAETRIEQNPQLPEIVTTEVLSGQRDAVNPEDQAVLAWRMVDLGNKRAAEVERINDPSLSPEERAESESAFQHYESELQKTEEADRKFGTTWGRTGQFRQRMINEDFTLGTMEARARVAKGEPLTAEEAQQIKVEADTIQKAEADRVTRTAEVDEAASMEAAKETARMEASPTYSERFVKWAESKLAEFDAQAEIGHRTIMELFGATSANPIQPKAIAALYHIAKAKIARGTYDLGKFTAEMIGTYGDVVKPFIKPAWDRVEKFFSTAPGAPKPPSKKTVAKQAAAAAEADGTEAGVAVVAEDGAKTLEEFAPFIRKLGQEYSRAGMQVEQIEARLHEVFSPIIEGVSPRELRDTWSNYGKSKAATTDPAKVAQAQRQGEAQKLSALEDLQRKLGNLELEGAKLTGQQRVGPSDRYRRLQTEINAVKKQIDQKKAELGIKDEPTEMQLKGALESLEKRTENRIKDLRFEIAKGERILKQKGEQPTSPRLEALRAELAEVQAEHQSVFGKREATPEQRLAQAIKAAEKAETAAQAELADARKGIFRKPEAKAAPAREVEAIRARAKVAKEETALLKKLANPPLSDAQKALDAAMVARERWEQVLAGEIAPSKKVPREALSQLEEDARLEIEAMRKLAAEMRAKPRTTEEERTLKALEKATAEYERRLNDADFAARGGPKLGPDTPKVAQARAVRDAAKAALDAARKAAGPPPKSKEEIAVQAYKTRTAARAADYADRVARGDFGPKARKTLDISKDPEAVRLKAEADTAKRNFEKKRFEWEQANRTKVKKFMDGVAETAAASRSLITSADVSAPMRQGVFFFLGDLVTNPKRAARQVGSMFKQLVSERGFEKAQAALSLRPNAQSGLYESSGLYLADLNSKMSAREESMRSMLAERIPIIGKIVRGSNRAYTGFLNRQRADAFDAMVEAAGGPAALSPEGGKIIADAVNALTGRGTAFGAERAADMAARFLFSPRLLVSRFQTALGEPIWNARRSGGLNERKIIAQQYVKFAAGLAAILGLGKLAGAAIELDPRSSDFLKLKFGNTRIDVMGGLQQVTRLIAQSLPKVGKVKTTEGKFRDTDSSTYGNFVRSKLAPIPAALLNLKAGKNVVGEPVTAGSALRDVFVPLSYQEIPDLYREQGPTKASAMQMLNLLGAGVSTYEPRKK